MVDEVIRVNKKKPIKGIPHEAIKCHKVTIYGEDMLLCHILLFELNGLFSNFGPFWSTQYGIVPAFFFTRPLFSLKNPRKLR